MTKHWTQTRAGKKRQSELQKARWAKVKNGATPPQEVNSVDEFKLMGEVVELFGKLPKRSRKYVRQLLAH